MEKDLPTLPLEPPTSDSRPAAAFADYIALARPDHYVKHVFIVPGIVLALVLHGRSPAGSLLSIVVGFLSAAAIASANYVLNEWLDAPFDAFHPSKSTRPAVAKWMSRGWVWTEYLLLAGTGLGLAAAVSRPFLVTSVLFLLGAVAYNVAPIRTKDRVYLDVLSEAINNPIRLTLGWAMIDATTLPPSSLLLAYWMGGAFLMAVKRFAEYRAVSASGEFAALALYRRSFHAYSENGLLVSAVLYAQMAAFFLAVFLIKYRVEYLLSLPLFAALFASYLRVGLKEHSTAQTPEKLFREKALLATVVLLVVALALLTWIDLPILDRLTTAHYIQLSGD